MFHKVTIIGNLGSDPETRTLDSGTTVTSFSVATNRRWTNNDGSPGEETVWWRVSAWGKLGEVTGQYLSKGRQVFIEGTLTPDRETGGPRLWTDQNGQPRAGYDLRADTVKFLGSRDGDYGDSYDGGQQSYGGGRQQQGSRGSNQQGYGQQQQSQSSGVQRRSTQQRAAPPQFEDEGDFGPDDIPF